MRRVAWVVVVAALAVAGLAATQDGGRTWRRLEHPHPIAGNHQMYTPTREIIVLFAEPGGWFVSTTAGQSFEPRPEPVYTPPQEYFADRPIERWCEPSPCHLVDRAPQAGRPVHQPGLPGMLTSVVSGADGRVAAASVHDGRPYTAISMNRGQTWQRHGVSVPDGVRLTRAEVANLGRYPDIWLYGYRTEERTEFPLLWLWSSPRWLPIATASPPEKVQGVAPMGSTWLGLDELGPGGPRRHWVQIIIEVG